MAAVEEARTHRLRPHEAQGGRALHPRPGQLRRRRPAARDAARRGAAQPVRARPDRLDRHVRRAAAPEGARRHHRQGPRGPGARLDADAVGRRAGRARHRQGALPGPGGRVRRRRRPLHRPRRARADRRRVRARCRRSSTPARRSTPTRPVIRDDKEGKTDNHIFDWEAGDRAATDAVFARAEVVVAQDMLYPRSHPAPMETCGAVADYDRVERQAHALVHDPGAARAPHALRARRRACPSTRSASSRPTSAAGSATRCRCTPATSARSSARSSPASR